jgi:hypothetical protein
MNGSDNRGSNLCFSISQENDTGPSLNHEQNCVKLTITGTICSAAGFWRLAGNKLVPI